MAIKKYSLLILGALVVAALVYAAWPKEVHTTNTMTLSSRTITVGSSTIEVDVADTDALREHGLSDRASMPVGRGMLFVFDTPGNWGIWMKDMHFALDILWLREDGTVITVARNVSPDTYRRNPPQIFYPATPDARYVVELTAGAAAGIAEGAKLAL